MLKKMMNKQIVRLFLVLLALILFFVIQSLMIGKQKQLNGDMIAELEDRLRCTMLIDEFRLVDQRLTRSARAFCATKEEAVHADYEYLYAWSSGKAARPVHLDPLITFGVKGEKISQLAILEKITIPDAILTHFKKALEYSDLLATYEEQAIQSVQENRIVSGPATSLPDESPDAFAHRILYDENYQNHVNNIADELKNFTQVYQRLIAERLEEHRQRLDLLYWNTFITQAFSLLGFGLLLTLLLRAVKREESRRIREAKRHGTGDRFI